MKIITHKQGFGEESFRYRQFCLQRKAYISLKVKVPKFQTNMYDSHKQFQYQLKTEVTNILFLSTGNFHYHKHG